MRRPHLVFDKPPSAGTHGLRRKSVLDAHRRVRDFLERATDCAGASGVSFSAPATLDDAIRAHFPQGAWHAGQELAWEGPRRRELDDDPAGLSHDALDAVLRELVVAPIRATVTYSFLLVDPRTGDRLPYEEADFADGNAPWSRILLFLEEGAGNHLSLVMTFPSSEPTEELVAIHDAAVATMGLQLSPPYWFRYTPSRRAGTLGRRKRISFDRNAWVTPPPDDDQPFLDQIRADPDDDGPRQVYADVLATRGDPRGAFINAQCELARLPDDSPRRRDLQRIEARLLAEHGKAWARVPRRMHGTLRRGFVEVITVERMHDYTSGAAKLRSVAPLVTELIVERTVTRYEIEALIRSFDELPLTGLTMRVEPGVMPVLAESAVWKALRRRSISGTDAEAEREILTYSRAGDPIGT